MTSNTVVFVLVAVAVVDIILWHGLPDVLQNTK